jgi:hypothetical protein
MTLPSRLAPPMPATTSPSSTQSPRLRSFITLLPRLRILIGLPSLSIRIPFSTPSPSSSSTCSHDCSSFQHPYPHRSVRIVPFESYPIQIQRPTIPSLPTATFFPTGPGLASHPTLRPLAPTYPSSSYPPYPKLFTTAASLSHHSFSSERPFVDAPLSAASWSSNAFISYQQLQHPHHVRNHVPNRYLAPPTPPLHPSHPFLEPFFAFVEDAVTPATAFSSSSGNAMRPLTDHVLGYPLPSPSSDSATVLPSNPHLPRPPTSTSSLVPTKAIGRTLGSVSATTRLPRRVPQSLKEMLEDDETTPS